MKVKDAIDLAVQSVSNCDKNMAQCAIKRYVTSGIIFQDGDTIVLKSYLEIQ